MTTEHTIKEYVQDYLTAYLLNHVWNRPCTEFRQNIRLRLSIDRKVTGNVDMYGRMVRLPNGVFHVYECPITRIIGVYPMSSDWVRVSSFINQTGLDLRFHGHYGEWLYRNDIYMKVDSGILLFAVDAEMYSRIAPGNDVHNVYLSIYRQPDNEGKMRLRSSRIFSKSHVADNYAESSKHDTTFINGMEVKVLTSEIFGLNDYVEMIADPDILGTFIVNLDGTHKTFTDSSDNKEKVIIHIPKSFNARDWLITHNTCDMYIVNKDSNVGVFLSRANTEGDIGQITHNDMYVSVDLIDDYMNHHGYSNTYLKVVVRRAGKSDVLIHERNYINVLYMMSDSEILQCLAGEGEDAFSFWSADALANSPYVKTMFNIVKPDTRGDLSLYLDTFGYLQTIDLVCGKVTHGMVYPYSGHTITVDIPVSMLHMTNLTCHVHIDGMKVGRGLYTVKRVGRTLEIELDESVRLTVGEAVAFEIFENVEPKAEYITPTSANRTLQVDGEFSVYRVDSITSSQYTQNIINSSYGIDKAYTLVTSGYTVANNKITFGSGLYNKNLLVISKKVFGTMHYSEFTFESLEDGIISTELMKTSSKQWMSDTTVEIPVLWNNFLVYLNGRELVKDIDYVQVELKTTNGRIIGYAIHATNIDYLDDSSANTLEVVSVPDSKVLELNDFSHRDTNDAIVSTLLWYENSGMVNANGSPVRIVEKTDEAIVFNNSMQFGSLINTRISLPDQLLDLFQEASAASGFDRDSDLARVRLIRDFIRSKVPFEYTMSKIEKSHNLYSVMLTLILKDYLGGTLTIQPGENIQTKIAQYLAVKDQDVVSFNNFNNITVESTDAEGVNGTYVLQGSYVKGLSRVWKKSNYQILYNAIEMRWVLMQGSSVLFRSTSVTKDYDPWNLMWESVSAYKVPYMSSKSLDLRYIDLYPSYKTYDLEAGTGYASKYKLLVDIIDTVLPSDTVQDGVTIQ